MRPFLGAVRVLFLGLLVSTVVADNTKCKNRKVRHEWRKLSASQRTEWMNAVNVCIPLPRTVHNADGWRLVLGHSSPRP